MSEDEKDRAEKERSSWQYCAIRATQGPRTKIGAVLLAVLGKQRASVPQFGNHAVINASGFIHTDMICKDGTSRVMTCIGQASEMVDGFRKLADILQLSDVDRIELFQKLQAWVSKDYRAVRDWAPREGRLQ